MERQRTAAARFAAADQLIRTAARLVSSSVSAVARARRVHTHAATAPRARSEVLLPPADLRALDGLPLLEDGPVQRLREYFGGRPGDQPSW
ncbi:hypothetical protein [Kitasatospora sp. LaBMicrA B282]|uniref:hypothetical protein n=1 Tax=Kitasatospora sp. LaBMicrA B282 TaxID=3420949 RepID=UPI003D109051